MYLFIQGAEVFDQCLVSLGVGATAGGNLPRSITSMFERGAGDGAGDDCDGNAGAAALHLIALKFTRCRGVGKGKDAGKKSLQRIHTTLGVS